MTDWNNWLLAHEPQVRLGMFVGVFALVATWETLAARRRRLIPRGRRWLANLSLVVVDTLVLRLAFPIAAVAMAQLASERDWGLLNCIALPTPLTFVASLIVLDLVIYFQHRLFHAVPLLWRLHLVHHADRDFDVTTGIRFHPIEILLSMGIKLGTVALLGPPAVAVIVFEVVLNATALFNHANARLPHSLDRTLRWLVVTPDMHRVHHSVVPRETNSNFGFNLPWWDRLFGTYRPEPAAGHQGMRIGIDQVGTDRNQSLGWMLTLPFRREASGTGSGSSTARS